PLCICDRTLQIPGGPGHDLLRFQANLVVLRCHLATNASVWTPANMTKFRSLALLVLVNVVAPARNPLQRGYLRGENTVHLRLFLPPMFLISCHGQIGLCPIKVVKASFVDLGAFADLVHAHTAVTAVPNKLERYIQQLLFGVTCASHKISSLNTDQPPTRSARPRFRTSVPGIVSLSNFSQHGDSASN